MPFPILAVAGGAVVGALASGGIEYLRQRRNGGPTDWSKIGRAALVGAVTGAISTATIAWAVRLTMAAGASRAAAVGAAVVPSGGFVAYQEVHDEGERFIEGPNPAPRKPLVETEEARRRLAEALEEAARADSRLTAEAVDAVNDVGRQLGAANHKPPPRGLPLPLRGPPGNAAEAELVLNALAGQIEATRPNRPPSETRGFVGAFRGATPH